MPRPTDTILQELLDNSACETQSTLELRQTNGEVLRLATDDLTIENQSYTPDLRKTGEIVQSAFANVDRTNSVIQNVDKQIGGRILNGDIDRARAVVGRFYRDDKDASKKTWVELFSGEAKPIDVANEASIEIVDDLVAAGYCVANWTMEPQCPYLYKGPDCGYTGAEPPCAKNVATCRIPWRFGGMESKDEANSTVPGDGGIRGGGGGGWGTCFIGQTLIQTVNGIGKPIQRVNVGNLVKTFDRDGKIHITKVTKTFRHLVSRINLLQMSDDSELYVTDEHPLLTANGEFVAVGNLNTNDKIRRCLAEIWRELSIVKKTAISYDSPIPVFNFEVEDFHVYFANGYGAHNSKDIGEIEQRQY